MAEPKPKLSLAEEILNFDDERTELVTVPEWGNKKILCKNMTGIDRAFLVKLPDATSFDIVMLGAYDPETGEKIFNPVQRERLGKKNTAALERLALTIGRLSGIGEEAIKEAEKN